MNIKILIVVMGTFVLFDQNLYAAFFRNEMDLELCERIVNTSKNPQAVEKAKFFLDAHRLLEADDSLIGKSGYAIAKKVGEKGTSTVQWQSGKSLIAAYLKGSPLLTALKLNEGTAFEISRSFRLTDFDREICKVLAEEPAYNFETQVKGHLLLRAEELSNQDPTLDKGKLGERLVAELKPPFTLSTVVNLLRRYSDGKVLEALKLTSRFKITNRGLERVDAPVLPQKKGSGFALREGDRELCIKIGGADFPPAVRAKSQLFLHVDDRTRENPNLTVAELAETAMTEIKGLGLLKHSVELLIADYVRGEPLLDALHLKRLRIAKPDAPVQVAKRQRVEVAPVSEIPPSVISAILPGLDGSDEEEGPLDAGVAPPPIIDDGRVINDVEDGDWFDLEGLLE